MASNNRKLATPYANPDVAGQMVIRTLWAGGLILLGYLIAFITPFFAGSFSSPGGGTTFSIPFFTGPAAALLIVAAERKKLNDAAGRKLKSWEIGIIRNATAAGQLVDFPDLIVAQEYYARRHMKVTTAYITGLTMTLFILLPPALIFFWLGALTPLTFAISSFLVALGSLYCAWWLVRRAAGSEATNAIFDSPLTPEEEKSL